MLQLNQVFRWGHTKDFFTQQDSFAKAKVGWTPKFKWCDNKTSVGIEVEVENINTGHGLVVNDTKTVEMWRNVEDGSLRNNGREFVSIPVAGENIEFALWSLNQTLSKNKHCVNHQFTDRTSVHVHIDFSTLSISNVATLLLVYHMVEPWLYAYAGGDRDVNIFTVPLLDTIMFDTPLRNIWSNPNSADYLDHLTRNWTKYTGLNMCPLRQYGTIEFRHMHGNCDPDFLCNWIDSLLQLRKFAVNAKFEDVLYKIQNINTTSEYGEFINEIFSYNRTLLDGSTLLLDKELEKSSARIKNILAKASVNNGKAIDFKGSVFHKLGIVRIKSDESFIKTYGGATTRAFTFDPVAIRGFLDENPPARVANNFDEVPEDVPEVRRDNLANVVADI